MKMILTLTNEDGDILDQLILEGTMFEVSVETPGVLGVLEEY